jgi:hypothetical protein
LTRSRRSAIRPSAMFIILITFVVLFVAVLAAHRWAANVIVERLWPKEDMARQLKPAGKSPAVDHRSMATPSPVGPGSSAPTVGPSTNAPLARPSVQTPVSAEAPAARPSPTAAPQAAELSTAGSRLPVPAQSAPELPAQPVTHARTIRNGPAQKAVTHVLPAPETPTRPATNAERQAAFCARHGDDYRIRNAARMREARARQRSAHLHAGCPELPERLAAS